ncbi:MAG: GGDEF domain-containing protein [Lachnospiraceae bacterium]|nr:GGDEF domain-containing protein [Lachnospiraceae bacterium]
MSNFVAKGKLILFVFLIVFIPGAFKCNAFADETDETVVKVGYYENESFQEGASEGAVKSGYAYEYYQKIATYNGWKYEYVYGSWADIYDAFVSGDIDLIAGLGYAEERLDIMNYPNHPMGYESYYLYIRGDDVTITLDSSSLSGKKIGTISGLLEKTIREWVKSNNVNAEIVVFDDVHERDQALIDGEIDALIGEGASVGSKANVVPLLKIKNVDMYVCVAKERTDLLKDLNYAQESLDSKEPYYINDLSKKYFSMNAISAQVGADEKKWLESHDYTITIGYMDNFLPYCGTDENGNATGIMVDVINEAFSNIKSDRPIQFVYRPYGNTEEMIQATHSHEIEIMFPVSNDIYYLEQNNLYHSVDVITSAMNLVYMSNPAEAEQGTLAINSNNQIQYNYAANYFHDNKIIYFDTVEQCLDAVVDGRADGTILSGLRAGNLLKQDYYSGLSYVELLHNTVKCFGVSTAHKGILHLLNQALNSIEENSAVNYSLKYIDNSVEYNYSIAEFLRRHKVLVVFGLMMLVIAAVIIIADDRIKTQKRNLYYEFAYKDGLTKLLNRRAYEEEMEKLDRSIPENMICVSMDLTGLKRVNDNLGHAAGDELISEAGRLITESFGKYGKIFRTGGDEYFGLLQADISEYEAAKAKLDEICENWKGTYSDSMKIAVGAASLKDVESRQMLELCKCADQRMYQAKSEWYKSTGINRRVN